MLLAVVFVGFDEMLGKVSWGCDGGWIRECNKVIKHDVDAPQALKFT